MLDKPDEHLEAGVMHPFTAVNFNTLKAMTTEFGAIEDSTIEILFGADPKETLVLPSQGIWVWVIT